MTPKKNSEYLITAYGLFWDREEVDWYPGGGIKWQLLGHNGGAQEGTRQVCDFRRSAGIYILWNEYRAVYVGLARGNQGLFSRLRAHVANKEGDWQRFSWFSIDDIVPLKGSQGWAEVVPRPKISGFSDTVAVHEAEALLILNLGTFKTGYQNRMSFQNASEWTQVTYMDYGPHKLMRKVAQRHVNQRLIQEWDEY